MKPLCYFPGCGDVCVCHLFIIGPFVIILILNESSSSLLIYFHFFLQNSPYFKKALGLAKPGSSQPLPYLFFLIRYIFTSFLGSNAHKFQIKFNVIFS